MAQTKMNPPTMSSTSDHMIWGLELHTWEEIMRGSLVAVGAFGLIGGLATWFVVSLQRGELAASKVEFERYKLETGEKISESNARTKEAELALAKLKAPRTLSLEAQARIVEKVKPFSGQEYAFSITPGPDALSFLELLEVALKEAGWVRGPPLGTITVDDGRVAVSLFKAPGVRIQVAPATSLHDAAARVLAGALVEEEIAAEAATSPDVAARPTVIQIVIGLKPL
jgi:hypothetical protein